ncbi:MAG TPA: efflux transporter periplasmic adaptor subunit, partial [Blastocatellia bacterium]|nr:efflux transporter periplasmic adaptor subunit [Blastocatellia bacterium]
MSRNAGHGCRPTTVVRRLSIVAVGASLVATWACGGSKTAAPTPPPVGVEVVEVKASDVPIFSDFVGQTFAREQVEVR